MTVTPVPGKLKKQADSYGGIVAALVELRQRNGLGYKAYDSSFHGIIEALLDLGILGNAGDGELPPGWDVITDGDGNIIDGDWAKPPENGQLWFDERQGRLFVWVDDAFYQTNGADGLTFVGENPPQEEVIGAMWYNSETKALYIYDGTDWNLIDMTGTLSTENLLMNVITTALAEATGPVITPFTTSGSPATQGLYNRWVVRALKELEADVDTLNSTPSVDVGNSAPTAASEADLFFDTTDQNLYVYSGSQWIPSFNSSQNNTSFVSINAAIEALEDLVQAQVNALNTRLNDLPLDTFALASDCTANTDALSNSLSSLSATVGDLSRFATNQSLADKVSALNTKIDIVDAKEPDFTGLATDVGLAVVKSSLEQLIADRKQECYSYANLRANEVATAIPDISGKANTADLQAFITQAAQHYFPRLGGTLNGTFGMEKNDLALPSFDFSNAHYYGTKVFKFKSNSVSDQYVEFGTNDTPWEYAWDFGANEDFCWKHTDSGKVFSIDENGPACEKLLIGQFGSNTPGGRYLVNKIEVGETLRSHKSALEEVRDAALTSSDFDTFRDKLMDALSNV